MSFLNPTYLWFMAGGLVPLAIHLWSRRKVLTIKVGSIRLLQESEPKRTSTIRLNELWLLALRMAIIFIMAVLLAGPRFKSATEPLPIVYLIEAGLLEDSKVERLLNETPEEYVKVLTAGFPNVAQYLSTNAKGTIPEYWQLARDMNHLPADSIVVIAQGLAKGLKGKRPLGERHVRWSILPTETSNEQLLVLRRGVDSLRALTLYSDDNRLTFDSTTLPEEGIAVGREGDSVQVNGISVPVRVMSPIKALVVYHDSLSREKRYISAALRALARLVKHPLELDQSTEADSVDIETYDLSIWLGKTPETSIETKRLIFKPNPLANLMIEPGTDTNEYFLTRYLNAENVLTDHLAENLYTLLGLHQDLNEKIEIADRRTLTVEELRPKSTDSPSGERETVLSELSPWWWGLLLFTLAGERILAKFRRQ